MNRSKGVPKFLRSCESAWRWAVENVDGIEELEEKAKRGSSAYSQAVQDQANQWACAYSEFANETYRLGRITAYRAIRVKSLDDIQWDRIGKAWSFSKEGAGVYGSAPDEKGMLDILIEAEVRPEDVDWKYGFTSFMYYGPDQSEVSLLQHSPVLVTSVDDQVLEKPVRANTGTSSEDWRT